MSMTERQRERERKAKEAYAAEVAAYEAQPKFELIKAPDRERQE
jgi:hypothetical protein